MRALILCLTACIVPPPDDDETGLEPDVDTDGDSDSDTDGDADTDTAGEAELWNASAISFDFSGAILGGEIVDGAILSGARHDASFGLSLMSSGATGLRNCNVRYKVAGAPTSVDGEAFDSDYWRSWDFSGLGIDEETGKDCATLESVFQVVIAEHGGSLESLLAFLEIQMGIEDMAVVASQTRDEWAEHWSFGNWDDDEPYLAAGGLYLAYPFEVAYEMNVFQGYAMDPETMEVEGDGFDLVPLLMKGADDVPDGFYTSSPMYIIGTDW